MYADAQLARNPGEGTAPFAADAVAAASAIRKALTDLVVALPGDVRRPRELERLLGLDYKLCWRIFNVIRADDLLAVANQIPKPPSIKRLLAAAEPFQLASAVLTSLVDASDRFNVVVRVHAGDRSAFDSMVSGVSPEDGAAQIDPVERRNAHRANLHIWGTEVDTFVAATWVRPGAAHDTLDECSLSAKLGLKRFRPGARTVVYRYAHEGLNSGGTSSQRPLDPEAERIYGASLLPAFCTKPMPEFKATAYEDGWASQELVDDAVGRRSAVDLAFGTAVRDVPFTRDADGRRVVFTGVTFNTPCATLVSDLFVHRPSFGSVTPELHVFRSTPGDLSPEVARRATQLPARERIVCLGSGLNLAQIPEMPNYPEMLAYACGTLGWDPAEFDLYRVRMAYPVLHSVARHQFYL